MGKKGCRLMYNINRFNNNNKKKKRYHPLIIVNVEFTIIIYYRKNVNGLKMCVEKDLSRINGYTVSKSASSVCRCQINIRFVRCFSRIIAKYKKKQKTTYTLFPLVVLKRNTFNTSYESYRFIPKIFKLNDACKSEPALHPSAPVPRYEQYCCD